MRKKQVLLLIIVGIITVFIGLLTTPMFQYLITLTPYYRTCAKIEVGMNEEQVSNIMERYQKYYRGKFDLELTKEMEIVYSSNNGNNCKIYTKNGIVDGREIDFD